MSGGLMDSYNAKVIETLIRFIDINTSWDDHSKWLMYVEMKKKIGLPTEFSEFQVRFQPPVGQRGNDVDELG
jgi:hypothetical protein